MRAEIFFNAMSAEGLRGRFSYEGGTMVITRLPESHSLSLGQNRFSNGIPPAVGSGWGGRGMRVRDRDGECVRDEGIE